MCIVSWSSWTLFRVFLLAPLCSSILKPDLMERGTGTQNKRRKVRQTIGTEGKSGARWSWCLTGGEEGKRRQNSKRTTRNKGRKKRGSPTMALKWDSSFQVVASFWFLFLSLTFTQVQSMFIELSKETERRGRRRTEGRDWRMDGWKEKGKDKMNNLGIREKCIRCWYIYEEKRNNTFCQVIIARWRGKERQRVKEDEDVKQMTALHLHMPRIAQIKRMMKWNTVDEGVMKREWVSGKREEHVDLCNLHHQVNLPFTRFLSTEFTSTPSNSFLSYFPTSFIPVSAITSSRREERKRENK